MADHKIVCISDFCKQYKISKKKQKQLFLLNEGVQSINEDEFQALKSALEGNHDERPLLEITAKFCHERGDTTENDDIQHTKKRIRIMESDIPRNVLQSPLFEDTTTMNESNSCEMETKNQQIFISSDCTLDLVKPVVPGYEIIVCSDSTPIPCPPRHFTALFSDDITASSSPPIFFPDPDNFIPVARSSFLKR